MAEEKRGFFKRLADGLSKTRNNIVAGMDAVFHGFSSIDDAGRAKEPNVRTWTCRSE